MLILTRKLKERIRVGENVEIEVVRIRRGSVQLGFVCPPEIRILRAELCPRAASAAADAPAAAYASSVEAAALSDGPQRTVPAALAAR